MKVAPKDVLEKIKDVKESQSIELNLSDKNLEYIPVEVFELEHLEVLNFRFNALTSVPDAISRLQNLKYLLLSANQLTAMPEVLCQLSKLTHLDLSDNQLTTVPEVLCQLSNLTHLFLAANRLTTLPGILGQLSNLTHLSLSANRLTTVPRVLGQLQNLTYLSLSFNPLAAVPEALGQLQNLKQLDLSANQLTTVPEALGQLQNLTHLYLHKNQLITVPETLVQLPKLSRFFLNKNPLETPPPEVAAQGIAAMREYFRQLADAGVDHLYEAKLLIVGEAGAGKTTLAQKIRDPDFQLREDEPTTKGIDVMDWYFPLADGRTFRVNLWDFGGQEIYKETHQFFLTKRSLYALVADIRKEDTDFYHWLNVVDLLSDNSPLLIVLNEKQDRRREIPESQLRGQFSNLKETLPTNLATNRGLDPLVAAIKHHIQQLPHVGYPLPKTWVKVREALENDDRNIIGVEEYLDLCQKNGFTEKQDKLQLSGFLHDLGVCLHFQEDPLLKNIIILKPKWGTDAVYGVLDNPGVINNRGRFTRDDLADIWSEPYYADRRDELLQLMEKFKLCYLVPGTTDTYMAPQLLSEKQPEYKWDDTGNLLLRYVYEFMPKGIITRFIVEMHRFISGQNLVWRSGVVLDRGDDTQAEIIEHYGKREVAIRVKGQNPRDLLAVITHELDKIHVTFKRLKWTKMVPCNCEKCQDSQEPHFFNFEDLRNAVAQREPRIQCLKSFKMIEVLNLIDVVMNREQFFKHENEQLGWISIGDGATVFFQQPNKGDAVALVEKSNEKPVKIRSAWANGSFYLFTMASVIGGLGVLAKQLPIYTLAIIIIAGAILVPIIGAFQLRQDDRLSEKSFLTLMKLVIGQLPLIGKIFNSKPDQE